MIPLMFLLSIFSTQSAQLMPSLTGIQPFSPQRAVYSSGHWPSEYVPTVPQMFKQPIVACQYPSPIHAGNSDAPHNPASPRLTVAQNDTTA